MGVTGLASQIVESFTHEEKSSLHIAKRGLRGVLFFFFDNRQFLIQCPAFPLSG